MSYSFDSDEDNLEELHKQCLEKYYEEQKIRDLMLSLYSEYIENDKCVFYKEHNSIIIFGIIDEPICLSEIEPKKYYSEKLKVELMFELKDPYKLVNQIGKYKTNDVINSYFYKDINIACELYQIYHDKQKFQEVYHIDDGSFIRPFNGLFHKWSTVSGKLISECTFEMGKEVGLSHCWDSETGNLMLEQYYVNGILHGLQKLYYKDGRIKSECMYSDGFQNGLCKIWYEDGTLKGKYNYVNGTLVQYYEDGVLVNYLCNYMHDIL